MHHSFDEEVPPYVVDNGTGMFNSQTTTPRVLFGLLLLLHSTLNSLFPLLSWKKAWTKAGFGGDDVPRALFPTVVGHRSQVPSVVVGFMLDTYVGGLALDFEGVVELKYPMQRGLIATADLHEMEHVWRHAYRNALPCLAEERPMIFTDSAAGGKNNATREYMAQVQFETFNVPAFFVNCQSVFALFASGRDTGTVLQSGEHTCAVPIVEGEIQWSAVQFSAIGGQHISNYLTDLLAARGFAFETRTELETVKDLKHKLSFVSADFDSDLRVEESEVERDYELPDGQLITVGSERFRCAEALFTKTAAVEYSRTGGVQQMLCDAIDASAEERRKDLFANVLLAGGNTMFQGMDTRLCAEMVALKKSTEVKVVATSKRQYSAFRGASIVSTLASFSELWISKEQYDEIGPSIVHQFHK